jgi:N-acetylmuramoyl-L-alanine amidase
VNQNKLKRKLWVFFLPQKKIKNGLISLTLVCLLVFFFTGSQGYLPAIQAIATNGLTVIIDPGHGGIDGGVSRGEDLLEKDINLDIAKQLRSLLRRKGYSVKMTRETDKDVSDLLPNGSDTRHRRDVHGRAKFINESNGDLFVSIHVNSCEDPYTRGAITFFTENNPQSEALAEIIQSHLNAVTKAKPQGGEYFHEKTRTGDFYILLHTDIPGVIVEVGFITSPSDKKLLATGSYRKKLAEAICAGIDSYVANHP